MSFQKCPKCNGEGTVQKVEINMEWKPGMNNGPAFYYANVSCPTCLGEFVIHEEQGVPPSKVTAINTRIDPEVLTKEQLIEFQKRLKAEGIVISQKK